MHNQLSMRMVPATRTRVLVVLRALFDSAYTCSSTPSLYRLALVEVQLRVQLQFIEVHLYGTGRPHLSLFRRFCQLRARSTLAQYRLERSQGWTDLGSVGSSFSSAPTSKGDR